MFGDLEDPTTSLLVQTLTECNYGRECEIW